MSNFSSKQQALVGPFSGRVLELRYLKRFL
jgi:hypothetical protein